MKKQLQSLSILIGLCLLFSAAAYAQTCVQVGPPAGALSPLLKSTGGFCPTPAQATNVCDCPSGFVAVGYEGQEGNSYGPEVLSQFTLRCRQLNTDGTLGGTVTVTCSNGTAAGNNPSGNVDASGNEALVGFEVRIGCAIDGIQGRSKSVTDVATGASNATNTMLAAIGGMGGSPQPLMLVPDGNVIIGMQSYEDPGNNISGGVAWRYAPIQTCMITGCNITNIALSNTSGCNDNGTDDNSNDDFFTTDIVVSFVDAPTSGTLNLTGAGANESVAVGALGANSYTFTNVQLAATGFSAILTATFSDNTACTLTDNAGLSPAPCSPNATGIPTMSEWGLILFALIMFTLTVVFGTQHQRSMAMANSDLSATGHTGSRFPFDAKLFFKALPWVYMAITAIFAVSIFLFGYELTSADLPGSLFAGAIIAYLAHYVMHFSKK
jgi:hypothetical protein